MPDNAPIEGVPPCRELDQSQAAAPGSPAALVLLDRSAKPAKLATDDLRAVHAFMWEFFSKNEWLTPETRLQIESVLLFRLSSLTLLNVRRCISAVGARDEKAAREYFPEASKPIEMLACGLLCVMERRFHEMGTLQDAGGYDSVRWWQLAYEIARIHSALIAYREPIQFHRETQKAFSELAHAPGNPVREAILAEFDKRQAEFGNYSRATAELWARFGREENCPFGSPETLREFLVRNRPVAYSHRPGRPKKHKMPG